MQTNLRNHPAIIIILGQRVVNGAKSDARQDECERVVADVLGDDAQQVVVVQHLGSRDHHQPNQLVAWRWCAVLVAWRWCAVLVAWRWWCAVLVAWRWWCAVLVAWWCAVLVAWWCAVIDLATECGGQKPRNWKKIPILTFLLDVLFRPSRSLYMCDSIHSCFRGSWLSSAFWSSKF